MRSLEKRFINTKTKKPNWSSYICFTEAIKNQRFNKITISKWFKKLVEKGDFEQNDKKTLLKELYNLSNPFEDNEKQG